jgi:hypothetical protein
LKKRYAAEIKLRLLVQKKNKLQPDMINYLEITETLYNSLISLGNIIENEELNLTFFIAILEKSKFNTCHKILTIEIA